MQVLGLEPRAEDRLNVLRQAMHVLGYGVESRKPNQCIKIGNASEKIGVESQKPIQCIKIWNVSFSAL